MNANYIKILNLNKNKINATKLQFTLKTQKFTKMTKINKKNKKYVKNTIIKK